MAGTRQALGCRHGVGLGLVEPGAAVVAIDLIGLPRAGHHLLRWHQQLVPGALHRNTLTQQGLLQLLILLTGARFHILVKGQPHHPQPSHQRGNVLQGIPLEHQQLAAGVPPGLLQLRHAGEQKPEP